MDTILQVRHIGKAFEHNQVLRDVSLELDEGRVLVVVGPSGCGKSTLLRCINGLEQIDSGEILLRGEVISGQRKNLHLVRQKIGMVFQSYDLPPHEGDGQSAPGAGQGPGKAEGGGPGGG